MKKNEKSIIYIKRISILEKEGIKLKKKYNILILVQTSIKSI